MTKKHLPDNLYQLSYDVRGNISQISDNDSSLIYSYTHFDDNDLVTSLSISGVNTVEATLSFDYDQNGNRTRRIDPTGTTNYSYDQLDRLTSLTTPTGRRFDYTYDVISRMTKIMGGVVDTSFAFDADNALSSMVSKNTNNVTISSLSFVRDQINNITRKTSSTGVSDFGYDEDSELISATNPDVSDSFNAEEFIYDELSNRIHDQVGSQTLDPKKQRLQEDYRYLYVYDMNGNLTSQQDKTATGTLKNYTYNSENQLIQVNIFENNLETKTVKYFYDALGRRSSKVITDINDNTKSYSRKYLYDAEEIIAEYDGSGNLLAKFTQSGLRTDDTLSFIVTTDGQSQGLAPNVGEYFYIKDQLGSITQIVDQNGNSVQRYTYSAFGKILKITDQAGMNTTNNPDFKTSYSFTNREYDQETGLYYYRARYYDANSGRFLQTDPDAGYLEDPISFNTKYAYAGNNGINNVDPSGEKFGSIGKFISGGVSNLINTTKNVAHHIAALDLAGAFDVGVTGYTKLNRSFYQMFGYTDALDMITNVATLGIAHAHLSEKDEVRITKVAMIVAGGEFLIANGFITLEGVGYLSLLSSFQAIETPGNFMDNFLNYEGGNLVGVYGGKVAYNYFDNKYIKMGLVGISYAALAYKIIKPSVHLYEKIRKQLRRL